MPNRIELYGDSISGNCYKLQLACSQRDVDYTWHEVDIMAGESRTDEFLAMNPNGKVPLMALPGGQYLSESNAILCYLADGSPLAGNDGFDTQRFQRINEEEQRVFMDVGRANHQLYIGGV